MAKFSNAVVAPQSAVRTLSQTPDTLTYNGADGYTRDAKSELFLLAVTNMVSETTFYEDGRARDERFAALVQQVTRDDPDWIERLIPWLRNVANLRTAPLVAAAEYCAADGPHKRAVVTSALVRADEPAEFIGYWHRFHKRTLSGGVQRGLQDAVRRLYDERSALRYDSAEHAIRMGDVIDLVHPKPQTGWQANLFRWLLDVRHKRERVELPAGCPHIAAYARLMAMPVAERREHLVEWTNGGFSWEALSGWLNGPMDRAAWEAVIPRMGYMALLRNLRNFDQAGVSDEMAATVATRLSDPEQVARSRQLPIRFYSAWTAAKSLLWGHALEKALDASLQNVPALPGRTLIMVDLSGSMKDRLSARSDALRWQAAATFGVALAKRAADATLVAYSDRALDIRVGMRDSTLRHVEAFGQLPGMFGGTQTFQTLQAAYQGHDRVVILTDEQADAHATSLPRVPMYTFNLAGYKPGHLPSGQDGRYTFGGLTDAAFTAIPLLEAHRSAAWPF